MVQFTFEHVYKYPWELVSHVHLTKYPTEKVKNVVGAEVIETRHGSDGAVFLKVIVTCLNVLPSMFRKLKVLDIPHVRYEEECWIDIRKRFLKLKSKPVGFESFVNMTEESFFTPFQGNQNWTQFKQEGTIEIIGFGRMSWLIEVFVTKFLTNGARQNAKVMEELIQESLANFNVLPH